MGFVLLGAVFGGKLMIQNRRIAALDKPFCVTSIDR
jgi:hypothetical protein